MNYLQRVIRAVLFPAFAKLPSTKSMIKKGIVVGLVIMAIIFAALSELPISYTQTSNGVVVVVYRNVTVHTSHTTQLLSPISPDNAFQDKLVGEYPNGTVVIASNLYNFKGSGHLALVGVLDTEGFTFESSNPPLPITAPEAGSQIVQLSFTLPKGYVGDLNYTLYYFW
jgi:hypothetical protein